MAEVEAAPFESVLIANRGEIAVRVARTCRELGVRSIAVYSEPDADALHVRVCDEAVAIGGVTPRESYLRIDAMLAAAKKTRAQAIHPGYGFLSENPEFARACARTGVVFVGPPPDAMAAVGDKIAAKHTAAKLGIPVLPGYSGTDQAPAALAAAAKDVGLPLLVKAAAGGGGRGMRLVQRASELAPALESAQREALAAFGDATIFLERYVARPRHVEVQVLADAHDNVAAFAERECSIQRRYQKIVEESPSSAVEPKLRAALQGYAAELVLATGYRNAGTVEFLLDEDGRYYFLEMNARLQVEHPVTEMVSGWDLVREQLRIAAGRPLPLESHGRLIVIPSRGHAIEVRLYAEDSSQNFLPSTGRITAFVPPHAQGLRHDVGVTVGSVVSPAYDSMLGKLIAYASARGEAIERLARALDAYVIGGVATNLGFLHRLVLATDFLAARTYTDFLGTHPWRPVAPPRGEMALAAAGALAFAQAPGALGFAPDLGRASPNPWQALGAWRHSPLPKEFAFDDSALTVRARFRYDARAWECAAGQTRGLVRALGAGAYVLESGSSVQHFAAWQAPGGVIVSRLGELTSFAQALPPDAAGAGERRGTKSAAGSVQAPMSGTIVAVNVQPRQAVKAFAVLAVMEAMKMEHAIVAPYGGLVKSVNVTPGQTVSAGETLFALAEE